MKTFKGYQGPKYPKFLPFHLLPLLIKRLPLRSKKKINPNNLFFQRKASISNKMEHTSRSKFIKCYIYGNKLSVVKLELIFRVTTHGHAQ